MTREEQLVKLMDIKKHREAGKTFREIGEIYGKSTTWGREKYRKCLWFIQQQAIEDAGMRKLFDTNVRAYFTLKRHGINTIQETREYTDKELLRMTGFGKGCLSSVRGISAKG